MAPGGRWGLEDRPFYLENTRTGVTCGCREWEAGDGSLLAQHSRGGGPTAPHNEDNAASRAGPCRLLPAGNYAETRLGGSSGPLKGWKIRVTPLSMGSVLKSHALGLVTSLQTQDDLWTQSGCSHSIFQCTQPWLGCSCPHKPRHSCCVCWVLMENRDNLSYLLHIRVGR